MYFQFFRERALLFACFLALLSHSWGTGVSYRYERSSGLYHIDVPPGALQVSARLATYSKEPVLVALTAHRSYDASMDTLQSVSNGDSVTQAFPESGTWYIWVETTKPKDVFTIVFSHSQCWDECLRSSDFTDVPSDGTSVTREVSPSGGSSWVRWRVFVGEKASSLALSVSSSSLLPKFYARYGAIVSGSSALDTEFSEFLYVNAPKSGGWWYFGAPFDQVANITVSATVTECRKGSWGFNCDVDADSDTTLATYPSYRALDIRFNGIGLRSLTYPLAWYYSFVVTPAMAVGRMTVDITTLPSPEGWDLSLYLRYQGMPTESLFDEHLTKDTVVSFMPKVGLYFVLAINKAAPKGTDEALWRAGISITSNTDHCSDHGSFNLQRTHLLVFPGCSCYYGWFGRDCSKKSMSTLRWLTEVLLLTMSNLAMLPAIYWTLTRNHLAECVLFSMTMVISGIYHACETDAFCGGMSAGFWRLLDFFFAYSTFGFVVLFFGIRNYWFRSFSELCVIFATLISVAIENTAWYNILIVGIIATCLIGITHAFNWRMLGFTTIEMMKRGWNSVIIWRFSVAIFFGLLGFSVQKAFGNSYYYIIHSGWHVCLMLGVYFALSSVKTRDKHYAPREIWQFVISKISLASESEQLSSPYQGLDDEAAVDMEGAGGQSGGAKGAALSEHELQCTRNWVAHAE